MPQTTPEVPTYTVAERRLIAATPDLRVQEMTLAPGEKIPWHYHSNVTDTFFCLAGELQIATLRPGQAVHLTPGETFAVPLRRAHEVSNQGQQHCRFVLVQGVGPYDFVPVARSA